MMWLGILTTVILWGLMAWGVAALWGWARRNRQGPAGVWHSGPGSGWRPGSVGRPGPEARRRPGMDPRPAVRGR